MEDKEIFKCAEALKNYCASKDNSCSFCTFYVGDCGLCNIPQKWNLDIIYEMTPEKAILRLTKILQNVDDETTIKALELAIKTLKGE
jgi:hypothetical protein